MNIRHIVLLILLTVLPIMGQKFEKSGGARTINATNNPDNSTLEVKAGNKIGIKDNYLSTQLQFKDTTSLKAASFDSAGFVVNLKQLSSSNTKGGGQFMLRPAAEYAVDGVTCFASGNASYEWVREAVISGDPVHAEWAGVVADGSTDDATALNLATQVAKALNRPLVLPGGSIRIGSTWDVSNASGLHVGFWAYGSTRGETIIVADDGIGRAISADGARTQLYIEQITLLSASASLNDTGLVMILAGNSYIDMKIGDNGKSFSCGFYAESIDHSTFHLASNYNGVNIHFSGTTNNGITIVGGGNSGTLYNMKLENFIGQITGEGGNTPIGLSVTGSNLAMIGYNWESCDSMFIEFLGPSPSTVTTINSRFLGNPTITTDIVARLGVNGDRLYWINTSAPQVNADSQIVVTATRAYVTATNGLAADNAYANPRVWWVPGGIFYVAGPTIAVTLTSGLLGSNVYDENRGFIYRRVSGGVGDDRLVVPTYTDSGYVEIDVLRGSRETIGQNTLNPGNTTMSSVIHVYGDKTITWNSATDSTVVTVVLPSPCSDILRVGAPVIESSQVTIDSFYVASSPSAGTITYTMFHRFRWGASTVNANLYYDAHIKD